jgi:hypothetical protein
MRGMSRPVKTGIATLLLHGGKDGHPFPVDRETYDKSIAFIGDAVRRARLDKREKIEALKRLSFAETAPEIL